MPNEMAVSISLKSSRFIAPVTSSSEPHFIKSLNRVRSKQPENSSDLIMRFKWTVDCVHLLPAPLSPAMYILNIENMRSAL